MTEREFVKIGWYNTKKFTFHPNKMDVHPQPWWAPVYVDTDEIDAAEHYAHFRRDRPGFEGRAKGFLDRDPCPICGHEHGEGCYRRKENRKNVDKRKGRKE